MTAFSYADDNMPVLERHMVRAIEALTGQPRLARLYRDYQEQDVGLEDFWTAAIRRLALDVCCDESKLNEFPRAGPVVVVANHPYGVLDGIVLGWLASRIRSDFRILTNAVLYRAPEVRPWLLPIDFSATPEALRTNLASRKAAHKHLAEGGAVLVFPAGGVSTSPDRLGRRGAQDAPWQPFVGQLLQRHRAPVMPVYFHGQNSRMFQIASHLSLTLRLSLIFKEVCDRMGTTVEVAIGSLIPFEALEPLQDRLAMATELRRITYDLGKSPPLP
jgi:putative hemolysin